MSAHMNKVLRSRQLLWAVVQPAGAPSLLVGQQGQAPSRGLPSSKHYLYKWRALRKKKVLKVDLPKFVQLKHEREKEPETPDETRMRLKKEGRLPPRTFQELPINISCTRSITEPYEPPEGDGKQSSLSALSLTHNVSKILRGTKSLKHSRTLRKYEDFDEADFAAQAQNMVIETQRLLQNVYKNQDRLHDLVTEKAFPEMVHGLETKTMRWEFVEAIEPPRVMQIRTEEMLSKDNLFAQVTVRLHTKQILAIYDRFGRLLYGDPVLPKSVVEYVVFEKWISDTYGQWRIHGKIVPDWMSPRDSVVTTYRVPVFEKIPDEAEEEDKGFSKKRDTAADDDNDEGSVNDDKKKGSNLALS